MCVVVAAVDVVVLLVACVVAAVSFRLHLSPVCRLYAVRDVFLDGTFLPRPTTKGRIGYHAFNASACSHGVLPLTPKQSGRKGLLLLLLLLLLLGTIDNILVLVVVAIGRGAGGRAVYYFFHNTHRPMPISIWNPPTPNGGK
jgi:hypothetical protein